MRAARITLLTGRPSSHDIATWARRCAEPLQVEDALTDRQVLTGIVSHLRGAVDASRRYLRVAQLQYRNGLADDLVVIDAERTRLGNQLALAQAENLQLIANIR